MSLPEVMIEEIKQSLATVIPEIHQIYVYRIRQEKTETATLRDILGWIQRTYNKAVYPQDLDLTLLCDLVNEYVLTIPQGFSDPDDVFISFNSWELTARPIDLFDVSGWWFLEWPEENFGDEDPDYTPVRIRKCLWRLATRLREAIAAREKLRYPDDDVPENEDDLQGPEENGAEIQPETPPIHPEYAPVQLLREILPEQHSPETDPETKEAAKDPQEGNHILKKPWKVVLKPTLTNSLRSRLRSAPVLNDISG
jgi:hypothetical protein